MSEKPTTVAVATYPTEAAATADYKAVWGVKSEGYFDHLALAVVGKNADGELDIDRHDTTAKHLAWGGGIVGALSLVFFTPGIAALAAGTGGLIGHFWKNIDKDDARRLGETLKAGEYSIILAAVNPKGTDVDALLSRAQTKVVIDGVHDVDGALEEAFEQEGV